MDHFHYRDGTLHCEDVPLPRLAERVETPCFVYSRHTLTDHFDRLAGAFAELDPLLCFSIKSCGNLAVCRALAERGAGMDIVSGGELHRARLAGVDPARCVFAGVGKTDAEIREAIACGVGWLNVESEAELANLRAIAAETPGTRERPVRAALRVNPDVDPKTHVYTTTGRKETKFGVDIERAGAVIRAAAHDERCRLTGIHVHLGSPVSRVEAYAESIGHVLRLVDELAADGITIEMIDIGGGFAADYESAASPGWDDYAAAIVPLLRERVQRGLQVVLEPGRTITANAGVLLVRVVYVKSSGERTFLICDGGMNVLLRPSYYGSFHFVWPVTVAPEHVPPRRSSDLELPGLEPVDVVGPVCESGDFLAKDRALPPVARGDLLAVFGAGAYGMVMASRYNSRPLPAEILVDGACADVVRTRERYDDLTAHELNSVPVVLSD